MEKFRSISNLEEEDSDADQEKTAYDKVKAEDTLSYVLYSLTP